jgi:hypothetical protein
VEFVKSLDKFDILAPDAVPYTYSPLKCDETEDECCALRNVRELMERGKKSNRALIERCNARSLTNYKKGAAFVFLHHITHHAGTFLCKLARKNVGEAATPPFICNLRRIADINRAPLLVDDGLEYCTSESPFSPKDIIPFGSEKIVFIHILRHPLGRFLSGDGSMQSTFPESKHGNYTRAARSPLGDNYALRFLSGAPRGCLCGGLPDGKGGWGKNARAVTADDLKFAKQRLLRFQVVMIQEWMDESMFLLCKVTSLTILLPSSPPLPFIPALNSRQSLLLANKVLGWTNCPENKKHTYQPYEERLGQGLHDEMVRPLFIIRCSITNTSLPPVRVLL